MTHQERSVDRDVLLSLKKGLNCESGISTLSRSIPTHESEAKDHNGIHYLRLASDI